MKYYIMYLVFLFCVCLKVILYIVKKLFDFKRFLKNTHIIYITHVLIYIILHDAFYLRNSNQLHYSYQN